MALVFAATPLLAGAPDQAVRRALGEVETGATDPNPSAADWVRGSHREVSRYQILPQVWASYSASTDFTNPARAWSVARRILMERAERFRRAAHREPSPFDLYVLWNAPEHFRKVGFVRKRVSPVVAERAGRFAALVEAHAGVELAIGNAALKVLPDLAVRRSPRLPGGGSASNGRLALD